jgi:hypothetical protein
MLKHLIEPLPGVPSNLDTGNAEIPGVVEKKRSELIGDPAPPLRSVFHGNLNPVRLLDRHQNHEIETLHRGPNARRPGLGVEGVSVPVGREIGEEVRRAAVEDLVGSALQEGPNRSLQLELEILEGGGLVERMPFFLQDAVGLLDRRVPRQASAQVFHEGRFAGAMRAGNGDPHGRLDADRNGLT